MNHNNFKGHGKRRAQDSHRLTRNAIRDRAEAQFQALKMGVAVTYTGAASRDTPHQRVVLVEHKSKLRDKRKRYSITVTKR